MGSYFVVVLDPRVAELLRVREAGKPARVEALVAKLAVEAFDETVLHGFARCDEIGEDAAVVGCRSSKRCPSRDVSRDDSEGDQADRTWPLTCVPTARHAGVVLR